MCIKLNERQERMKNEIQKCLDELRKELHENHLEREQHNELFHKMGSLSHKLYMSLEFKPKHHKYMINNIGMQADNPDFYYHISPVEDLIAYLNEPIANDFPVDTTIDKNFTMEVYSKRWSYHDKYFVKRTHSGWYFKFKAYQGEANKKGEPTLYKILNHDSISYPKYLDDFMEYLWDRASDGLNEMEVQNALNDISKWISSCEMNTPIGIFEDFK